MKCASCGYQRQLRDNAYVPRNECPSCGVMYAKSIHQPPSEDTPARPEAGYKSPVDENSLRQARERVEKRLRKQLEAKRKDERHQQTLARAKEIAAAEVRRRKEERERQQNQPQETPAEEPEVKIDAEVSAEAVTDSGRTKTTAAAEISADDTAEIELADDDAIAPLDVNSTWPSAQPEADTPNKPPGNIMNINKTASDEIPAVPPAEEIHDDEPVMVVESVKASVSPPDAAAGEIRDEPQPQAMPHHPSLESGQRTARKRRRWLLRAWPMVAWLLLASGVVGAVLSWSTIGHVEASVGHALGSSEYRAMPLGLLLGFAYLATGVLGFAFFWVTSAISRQLGDIHRLLLIQSNAPFEETE